MLKVSEQIMSQTHTAIVARNTTYQLIAKAITMVLSILTFALVARFLSVVEYGQFTLISTIFALIIGFGDLRIEQLAVRSMAEDEENIAELATQSTITKVLFSLLISIIAYAFISFSGYPQIIKNGVAIVLVGVLFNALCSGFQSSIQYHLKAYLLTFAEVIAKVFVTVMIGVVFWLGSQSLITPNQALPIFVAIAMVISPLIVLICYSYWAIRQLKVRFVGEINRELIKSMLRESWPLWFMGLLALIHYRAGVLILDQYQSDFDVGIYGLAYRFLDVAVTLPPLFIASVYPLMSRYAASDPDKVNGVLVKSFTFMFIFVILISAGTYYAAPQIIVLFGGEGYSQAIGVLKVLSLAMVGSYLSSIFVPYLIAFRLQRYAVWTLSISVLVNLALNYALVPQLTYLGSAIAIAISEILGFVLLAILVNYKFNAGIKLSMMCKTLLAAAVMLFALWLTGLGNINTYNPLQAGLQLMMIGLIGVIVYGAVIWLLKVVDSEIIEESLSMLPLPAKAKKIING